MTGSLPGRRRSLAWRAALYSGLVLPGLGQWFLGRRRQGAIIMTVVVLLVFILGVRVFLLVYHGMVPDGEILNLQINAALIRSLHRRAYLENWWLLLAIIGLWIGSTVDAFKQGKKREVVPLRGP